VEVAEQVERISAHPSLALFCGNNELDVAWYNWGWQDRYGIHGADSSRAWTDHQRFFHETLREATAPVPYTPTSPLSNWGNAAGLRSGDLHYWGVWHADSTFDSFAGNVGRFVSEYGFQSYPDSITLTHYIDPGQLHLGSSALAFRQRSYRTDRPIKERIKGELGLEPTTLGAFLDASQEVQALAYAKAIAAHAAARPRCMGTLLWQLNEPWPGPSWSVLGYGGQRKTAFEVVRKAYLGIQQTDPTR
jgi:beta-mannosidase